MCFDQTQSIAGAFNLSEFSSTYFSFWLWTSLKTQTSLESFRLNMKKSKTSNPRSPSYLCVFLMIRPHCCQNLLCPTCGFSLESESKYWCSIFFISNTNHRLKSPERAKRLQPSQFPVFVWCSEAFSSSEPLYPIPVFFRAALTLRPQNFFFLFVFYQLLLNFPQDTFCHNPTLIVFPWEIPTYKFVLLGLESLKALHFFNPIGQRFKNYRNTK